METNSQNFCRACMKNVDDPGITFIKNSDLINKYLTCTSIEVDFEDGLPLNLCQRCCSSLNEYYDFRRMCLESYQKMLSFKVGMKADDPNPGVSEPLEVAEYKIEIEEMFISEDVADLAEVKSGDDKISVYSDQLEKPLSSDSDSASITISEDDEDTKDRKKKTLRIKNRTKTERSTRKQMQIKCPKCPKTFFQKIHYEGHMRRHDGLKPYVCDICQAEHCNYTRFREHQKFAHSKVDRPKFVCTEQDCNKTLKSLQSLQHHIKGVHQGKRKKSPCVKGVHQGKRKKSPCVCEQCGQTLSCRSTLKRHMSTHTGHRPFACDQCPRKFIKKNYLNEHLWRHNGIKNYTCGICGAKKTTTNELNRHVKTHNPVNNHKCELCPKAFSHLARLKRHIDVVHNRIKKYSCTSCDASFGKPDTLKYHLMIHTGEKPEICPICDKRFRQRVALKTHMKTHNKFKN